MDPEPEFSIKCTECNTRMFADSEEEVKEKADEHNAVEHPDCGPIEWEWIQ